MFGQCIVRKGLDREVKRTGNGGTEKRTDITATYNGTEAKNQITSNLLTLCDTLSCHWSQSGTNQLTS